MKFPMQLLGDLIAVRYEPVTHAGQIALPDWQRSYTGTVIAVGPGAPLTNGGTGPMETEVGDHISFGAAIGMEAVYDGGAIRIMRDTEADFVVEA